MRVIVYFVVSQGEVDVEEFSGIDTIHMDLGHERLGPSIVTERTLHDAKNKGSLLYINPHNTHAIVVASEYPDEPSDHEQEPLMT